MDNVNALLGGFADVITPMNLLIALLGVTVGTAVGVLPGIGPAMTVALLLPITYGLPVEQSLQRLIGALARQVDAHQFGEHPVADGERKRSATQRLG